MLQMCQWIFKLRIEKKNVICSFSKTETVNHPNTYLVLLYILKVMFILQAVNEINEFSQHSKPPPQKQKLNCNKSWVYVHVFMGWERFTVPQQRKLSWSKRENYYFSTKKVDKLGHAKSMHSLHFNDVSNLLKVIIMSVSCSYFTNSEESYLNMLATLTCLYMKTN